MSPTAQAISQAVAELKSGRLVAFPTETVYGLGVDACSPQAVARLYEAKGRPAVNPLIVHLGATAQAERICAFDKTAHRLAEAFWPGPITIVAPLADNSGIAPAVTAGLMTLAVRVPAGEIAQSLLTQFARPIAAPSANRSGRPSATEAQHILDDFAEISPRPELILDGGATKHGLESTIVLCDPAREAPALLRFGAISRQALEEVLSTRLELLQNNQARPLAPLLSPGQGFKHYAPAIPVRMLEAGESPQVASDEAWLGFAGLEPIGTPLVAENLSPTGVTAEAERVLFSALRRLETSGARAIVVAPLPASAEALTERVRRATFAG